MTNRVFISSNSLANVGISFLTNGFGWTLQSVTNLGDPWREVQLVQYPFTRSPSTGTGNVFTVQGGTNRYLFPKTNRIATLVTNVSGSVTNVTTNFISNPRRIFRAVKVH
jgi:hypothetical protein